MRRTISRIAPWQAGKLSAVILSLSGLVLAVPVSLNILLTEPNLEHPKLPIWFPIAFPVIYAFAGLIFAPLYCLLYNLSAKLVGGLSIDVEDDKRG